MPVKPILIAGRLFQRGINVCPNCDRKYRYLLPVDILPLFDELCSDCSFIMPEVPPVGDQIVIEIKEF